MPLRKIPEVENQNTWSIINSCVSQNMYRLQMAVYLLERAAIHFYIKVHPSFLLIDSQIYVKFVFLNWERNSIFEECLKIEQLLQSSVSIIMILHKQESSSVILQHLFLCVQCTFLTALSFLHAFHKLCHNYHG